MNRLESHEMFSAWLERCRVLDARRSCKILVCAGASCLFAGAKYVKEAFRCLAAEHPEITVEMMPEDGVYRTGCQGFCSKGPLVRIRKGDRTVQYMNVHARDCKEIFERSVLGDELVERLLYKDGDCVCQTVSEIPFYAAQSRRLLDSMAERDVGSLEDYAASGGLRALEKTLFAMTPEDVVRAVEDSGLRGRGGGGFSTGFKWRAVQQADSARKVVVCNGDEGDPGAFLDGAIMEGDPFRLIEGMTAAAYAVGAQEGFIYVRTEYPVSIRRLNHAIGQMEQAGLLGENILGTGFSFRLTVYRGAGAFVCGEESALVNSLEGRRGMPRLKPPYLATVGYQGLPTLVNNVETYANVPFILENGAEAYRRLGTESCPGTKIYSLSGAVRFPGLVEVPLGTTLRELIFGMGGGMKEGSGFKAALVGGPTGRCLTEKHLDIPFDFETASENDAIVGSGGVIVLDETSNMVELSQFLMAYLGNGKTVLCRAEDADKYTSIEAINRPEVTVMENPGGLNEKFARENLPDATLIIHDVNEEIPGRVAAGEADVMITEILEAGWYVGQDSRLAAPLIYEPFTTGQLGVLMPKGSEALLDYVNAFLASEKASGRIDALAEEYIYQYIDAADAAA